MSYQYTYTKINQNIDSIKLISISPVFPNITEKMPMIN